MHFGTLKYAVVGSRHTIAHVRMSKCRNRRSSSPIRSKFQFVTLPALGGCPSTPHGSSPLWSPLKAGMNRAILCASSLSFCFSTHSRNLPHLSPAGTQLAVTSLSSGILNCTLCPPGSYSPAGASTWCACYDLMACCDVPCSQQTTHRCIFLLFANAVM